MEERTIFQAIHWVLRILKETERRRSTMPELPEMETYRKLLSERLSGKEISTVTINREKSINMESETFISKVQGARVQAIHRRAKHLIFKLSTGDSLLLHLMLGGWMYVGSENDQPKRTKQVILSLGEMELYFIGLRLGYLHLLSEAELEKELSDLGPEPLNGHLTYTAWLDLIGEKRGRLKTTLLDQQFIAGIGNCYSDEICYGARLMPTKHADTLDEGMQKDLYDAIQSVLQRALGLGGYMDQPLYKGDTFTGGYNDHCFVYDRVGEVCGRCGGTICFEEVSSRKCFYCPGCQRD
jgi:formamidopyrimidine-DNA glycosylase